MADQWDAVAAALRAAVRDTVAALTHPDPPSESTDEYAEVLLRSATVVHS